MSSEFKKLIKNFPEQLMWQPELEGDVEPSKERGVTVGAMGGSALSGRLFNLFSKDSNVKVHSDYGIPDAESGDLHIAVSYSGNTEEVLSFALEAESAGRKVVAITSGGELLSMARDKAWSHVILPDGLPPRMAVGYMLKVLSHIIEPKISEALEEVSALIDVEKLEIEGEKIAEFVGESMPLVYAPTVFAPVAYLWKTNFNETAKTLSFWNVVPESNHNELEAVLGDERTRQSFCAILLSFKNTDQKIIKRMKMMGELFEDKGIQALEVEIEGDEVLGVLNSVILSMWTAFSLAELNGVESSSVLHIEEFKNRL